MTSTDIELIFTIVVIAIVLTISLIADIKK